MVSLCDPDCLFPLEFVACLCEALLELISKSQIDDKVDAAVDDQAEVVDHEEKAHPGWETLGISLGCPEGGV